MTHSTHGSEKQERPITEVDDFADWREAPSRPFDPSETEEAWAIAEVDRILTDSCEPTRMPRATSTERMIVMPDAAYSDPKTELAVEPRSQEEPVAEKPRRNLTLAQWAEIELSYELGNTTAAELSRKYDISPQALSKRFKSKGIVKGSKVAAIKEEAARIASAKAVEATVAFEQKRMERAEQTKEQSYNDAVVMRQLALKKIQTSLASGATPLSIKELGEIQDVLDRVRKARYEILDINGADEGGNLPILPIERITDKDIEEIRDSQEEILPDDAELIH